MTIKAISAAALLAVLATGAAANDLDLFGVDTASRGASGGLAAAGGSAGFGGVTVGGIVVGVDLFEETADMSSVAVSASTAGDYLFNQQSNGGQSVDATLRVGNFNGTYGNYAGYALDVRPGHYDMDMGNKVIIDVANSASNSVNSFVADASVDLDDLADNCGCKNIISQQSMTTALADTSADLRIGNFNHTIGVDLSNSALGSANSITLEQTEINLAGMDRRGPPPRPRR